MKETPKRLTVGNIRLANRLKQESQKFDFGQTEANCITFNIEQLSIISK